MHYYTPLRDEDLMMVATTFCFLILKRIDDSLTRFTGLLETFVVESLEDCLKFILVTFFPYSRKEGKNLIGLMFSSAMFSNNRLLSF